MNHPDIFTNVHKGIRKALFDACLALGRAGTDQPRDAAARSLLRQALRFVVHHGENEDLLLVPLLAQRAPEVHGRMLQAHQHLNESLSSLIKRLDAATSAELYRYACEFTAHYLSHMHEEEAVLEPAIRGVLSIEELATFSRRAVERTAPDDQRMMLGWMLPAMTRDDAEAFLSRVPVALADELRGEMLAQG